MKGTRRNYLCDSIVGIMIDKLAVVSLRLGRLFTSKKSCNDNDKR